jgi:hypothetical protein
MRADAIEVLEARMLGNGFASVDTVGVVGSIPIAPLHPFL